MIDLNCPTTLRFVVLVPSELIVLSASMTLDFVTEFNAVQWSAASADFAAGFHTSRMVQLNAKIFWARIGKLLDTWNVGGALDVVADSPLTPQSMARNGQDGQNHPDFLPLADLDAILILSGEAPAEDEAVRKSTAFQVRDLFPQPIRVRLANSYFTRGRIKRHGSWDTSSPQR
jgi:hypothetical protein